MVRRIRALHGTICLSFSRTLSSATSIEPKKLFLGDERRSLRLACEELRRQEQKVPLKDCIPSGMEHFEAYVQSREERIFALIESRFPRALGFGAQNPQTRE